ncbi:phosphinothricin acetyltransferase [Fodinibius salinus]|uniref:Phosphinothricin acetyltransferase n=1 Tax=Fodinibius salinus TaxID=860790 RepID=A0A5D3YL95_9BACT|nr:GNAT family N-acetyltransferase [Fodinibius salinus]TYP94956.1 phosphinothricin acetyltransferase [Fodinibius salinus]
MITIAESRHLKAINDIYNQAVEEGFRTAHTQPMTLSQRALWFQNYDKDNFPVFIYQQDQDVLGWLSVSPYKSDRQALNEVVEISYYVDYNHHGKGIATKLMEKALNFCRTAGYRIMVAILMNKNTPSMSLLQKFDFTEGGRIPDAIHYQDEFRDHLYMFKKL